MSAARLAKLEELLRLDAGFLPMPAKIGSGEHAVTPREWLETFRNDRRQAPTSIAALFDRPSDEVTLHEVAVTLLGRLPENREASEPWRARAGITESSPAASFVPASCSLSESPNYRK